MTIAVFDYDTWVALYPEFANLPPAVPTAQFGMAGLYLNNTECSPVCDVTVRGMLLGMITAHLCKLNAPGASPLVGRISNASEGSVSVAVDVGQQSASSQFWMQTPYGFQYWQATARYRTARYVAAPPSQVLAPPFYAGLYRQPGQW